MAGPEDRPGSRPTAEQRAANQAQDPKHPSWQGPSARQHWLQLGSFEAGFDSPACAGTARGSAEPGRSSGPAIPPVANRGGTEGEARSRSTGPALRSDVDVAGVEIAMTQPELLERLERGQEIEPDSHHLRGAERPARHQVAERDAGAISDITQTAPSLYSAPLTGTRNGLA